MSANPPKMSKKTLLNKERRVLFQRMVHNEIQSRIGFMRSQMDPAGRDLDKDCGYIDSPTVQDYRQFYDREGIASRVVNVYPDECWSVYPALYEVEENKVTKFERAWAKLNKRIPCWHYLHRADRLSGIGRFGVILLGLDDGQKLDSPARGITKNGEKDEKRPANERKLLYLRPFSEELVTVEKYEDDPTNPRYGQPVIYDLVVSDPNQANGTVKSTQNLKVHWTRIVHLADNRECSEVHGVPRMQAVLNRIQDLRKILSSSAEMFWKGGFPGYSFESFPELAGDAELDEDSIKDQLEAYMNGLKRYLAATGGSFKSLAPQVADPSKHVEEQLRIVAATIGVPMRILMGSESGHLASTQDAGTWNKRVAERQLMYLEPMLIRPFVDRLILLGVLPEVEDYIISWRDLNTMSDTDKANVALKRAQALMQYVSGGCETVLPPKEFLIMVLGFTVDEAEAIITAQKENTKPVTDKVWQKPVAGPGGAKAAKTQGGGRRGNAPKQSPGRPAQRVAKA